jgi:hypothetical protein
MTIDTVWCEVGMSSAMPLLPPPPRRARCGGQPTDKNRIALRAMMNSLVNSIAAATVDRRARDKGPRRAGVYITPPPRMLRMGGV